MAKFLNKKTCYIGKNVKFGKNVVVYENNHIEGNVEIGDDCLILPGNFIVNAKIGKNCKIHQSIMEDCVIKDDVSIGPFSRLRPKAVIEDKCKIGNFVEIKNSLVGSETKISHLAYVGDCEIGQNCNIGCGVIFANYDGKNKHKTSLGNHVFVGSNCNIIAPVKIEDDSYICAGTTITNPVKKGDFVIGRIKQENKAGNAKKYW
ncbi:MAG: hypothetical protein IJX25_00595 [Clostridia bacterium]|nr:hypothetical protein [Clostridia bacterium]